MRAGNEPAVFVSDAGLQAGLYTSADFCAEHECGSGDLQKALKRVPVDVTKADCTTFGLANRMIDADMFQKNAIVVRTKQYCALVIVRFAYDAAKRRAETIRELQSGKDYCSYDGLRISALLRKSNPEDIVAAWDSHSMGFAVGPKYFDVFEKVVKACQDGYGFLAFSKTLPVFDNGGYVLMDSRDLPKEVVQKMEDEDRDVHMLYKEHRRIGIVERIDAYNRALSEKTGKRWFDTNWDRPYAVDEDGTVYNAENFCAHCGYGCLSPRWATDTKGTKYTVMYWLNPQNQQQNFFGWVTVEDLEDWMQGKGRIPGHGFGLEKIKRTQAVAKGSVKEIYSDEIYCKHCGIVNTSRQDVSRCPKCGAEDIVYPVPAGDR